MKLVEQLHTLGYSVLALLSVWYTIDLLQFTGRVYSYHSGRSFRFEPGFTPRGLMLNLGKDNPVLMRAEESVHYDQAERIARKEWAYNFPKGDGMFHYGPDHQAFGVAIYHELHCVQSIDKELGGMKMDRRHLEHCFQLLRQMILCRPDLTLEPGDFTERNFTTSRVGELHVCWDWQRPYDASTLDWVQWDRWRRENGIDQEHYPIT